MRIKSHWSPHALACVLPLVALGAATPSTTAQTPQYSGAVCPDDSGNRIRYEVQADEDVTFMILFSSVPDSGGLIMDQEAPGLFTREIDSAGVQEVTFSLLMQNPTQYVFPEHTLSIADGCATFERDDVTPPPARGFRHDIEFRDGNAWWVFEAGAASINIPGTTAVEARFRIESGEIESTSLTEESPGVFSARIPALLGERIEYWFSQLIGVQTMETALFERVIGDAAADLPTEPIVTRTAARFRHRHPYEWRFDNYVEIYESGRAYGLEIVDLGNKLEAAINVDPSFAVGRIDFKYFVQNGPSMCDRGLTQINMVMERNGSTFTLTIPDVTHGAIIDFDLTFTDLPADSPVGSYYSDFCYYQVGFGKFGKTSNPRAHPVGAASIPHVVSPRFGFSQHAQGMTKEQIDEFLIGKLTFETDFETAELLNHNTRFDCCYGPLGTLFDVSPVHRDNVLGPRYATTSCINCHMMDGRGSLPDPGGELDSVVLSLSIPGEDEHGGPIPHPLYGHQLDVNAVEGTEPEGRVILEYEYIDDFFQDGTPYQLRKPVYTFRDTAYGSIGTNIPDEFGTPGYDGEALVSARIAPMLTGLGLLEAVDEATILANSDPGDSDGDGISGRANFVWNIEHQQHELGRFGWKANQPSLKQQAAMAFNRDMGLTNEVLPVIDCGPSQSDCDTTADPVEIPSGELDHVVMYLRGLVPPPRNNYEDPEAIIGMQLFKEANCHACHVPSLKTSSTHEIESYRGQSIQAFTDLLLHDMGEGLSDTRPDFEAGASEWRTPPLWAMDYVRYALGLPDTCEDPFESQAEPNFLHDGRARSLSEAILWHGGEALSSREAFRAMSATERDALLAYVAYPFDDPILAPPANPCPTDLDGDGLTAGEDLSILLGHWGSSGPGDLDGNALVDGSDLTILLSAWGGCP